MRVLARVHYSSHPGIVAAALWHIKIIVAAAFTRENRALGKVLLSFSCSRENEDCHGSYNVPFTIRDWYLYPPHEKSTYVAGRQHKLTNIGLHSSTEGAITQEHRLEFKLAPSGRASPGLQAFYIAGKRYTKIFKESACSNSMIFFCLG